MSKCNYCGKKFETDRSVSAHKKYCDCNPNVDSKSQKDKISKISNYAKGKTYEEIHGKHKAEEIKNKMSSSAILEQLKKPRKHTTETKEKIAKAMKGNNYGCGRGKKEWYKEILFKSSWEVKTAKFLDSNNIKWLYEHITYDITDRSQYTPDFFILDDNQRIVKIIEVKGYKWEYGMKKLSILKGKINIPIELWDKDVLKNKGII